MNRELFRAAQAGDRRARGRLWLELSTTLGRFFLPRTIDADTAMELTQRSLIALFESPEFSAIEDPGEVLELMYKIAGEQLRRHRSEQQRDRRREELLHVRALEVELLGAPSLEHELAELQWRELLARLVEMLPAQLKRSWELRKSGASFLKIGRLTKVSESTAQRRFETARRRLRRELERARRTRDEFRSPSKTGS